MKTRNALILTATTLALFGAGGALAQQSAKTPQSANAPGEQEIIRVQAPRAINDALVPQGRAREVFLSAQVTYGDLDLKTAEGASELQDRIETAAKDVCTKLATAYPQGTPPQAVCTRDAAGKAMQVAQAAIDRARTARG